MWGQPVGAGKRSHDGWVLKRTKTNAAIETVTVVS